MEIKYFPMFHSYLETLSGLTDEQFGKVIRAALQYSVNGTVPELDSLETMAFGFIKLDIDRAREKYENIAERNRINGMKGGRPRNPENPVGYLGTQKTQTNPEEPKKPIEREKEKEKAIEKESEKVKTDPAPKKTRKVFVPPTEDDVRAYCTDNGLTTIDPGAFVDYYEANGWKVGGQGMKDWKATLRNWARRDKERGVSKPVTSFDTDEFFNAALARSYGTTEGGDES